MRVVPHLRDGVHSRPLPGRIPCRAVFLDAGGVIILPDRHLLAGALAGAGIDIAPDAVPRAHYLAVRALDRSRAYRSAVRGLDRPHAHRFAVRDLDPPHAHRFAVRDLDRPSTQGASGPADYQRALLPQLGIVAGQTAEALGVWERLADRGRSGQVLWSEPTPGALQVIASLRHAGIRVVIVTNSDGHAGENLAACGFAGLPVIDSTRVGAAKPDPHIFRVALERVGVDAGATVHVGDSLADDIAGARAAGITPIHFDPLRGCRARDHRHVRSLAGIWRHVSGPR